MGTTVTSNLSLIKPDSNESIKQNLPTFNGWAAQNGSNVDTLDSLFRATQNTWVPTFSATGGGFSLGSGGFFEGKFLRQWPRMVICHWRLFAGGAGFAPGVGNYKVNLPVAPPPEFGLYNDSLPIGKAHVMDFDNLPNGLIVEAVYDISSGQAMFRTINGPYLGLASPITLAQNDRITGYFIYPTSVP